MKEEVFRPIPGHEKNYEVSENGTIRSIDRVIVLQNEAKRLLKGKVLAPKQNGDGYLFVSLSEGNKAKTMYVHRAIALAFIDNPENKPEVNHKNGCKYCNNIENLEWVTHRENAKHCYEMDLCKNKGENHFWASGVTDNELGRKFGTIKEWCEARGFKYSTGRNILSGWNKSKLIDLTKIVVEKKG